jgi:hypothetical protein
MRSALFWDITQRWVVIVYRRFGTTYRSHLQRSRSPRRLSSLTSWPLKIGPIGCPETAVQYYHSTLCNIAQERRSHFIFGMMTLMATDKLTITHVSHRPLIQLHHLNRKTGEELKNACYSFTTLPTLRRKCLTDFHQNTYETKGNKHWTR